MQAIFLTAGYPSSVARLLAGLCTTRAPADILASYPGDARLPLDLETSTRLSRRHLPQGAPTSPALANLSAYKLDVRLSALAQAFDATYTRYADDLAFSGSERLERGCRRFQILVAVIAAEEGFTLHPRKSRFMRRGIRQQLASVVVNAHPNVRREEFDLLKAILFNCVREGPTTQNRLGARRLPRPSAGPHRSCRHAQSGTRGQAETHLR